MRAATHFYVMPYRLETLEGKSILYKLKLIKFIVVAITPIIMFGCAAVTHTNLGEGIPNAKLHFELLTSDFAGGGHLGVSTDATCKKSISVSDYTRISDFRKGHSFREDVDKFEASIPAGKELMVYGRNLAPRANCDARVIFTPEVGADYLVTYAYKLPGCELRIYKINDTGSKAAVEIKECK